MAVLLLDEPAHFSHFVFACDANKQGKTPAPASEVSRAATPDECVELRSSGRQCLEYIFLRVPAHRSPAIILSRNDNPDFLAAVLSPKFLESLIPSLSKRCWIGIFLAPVTWLEIVEVVT